MVLLSVYLAIPLSDSQGSEAKRKLSQLVQLYCKSKGRGIHKIRGEKGRKATERRKAISKRKKVEVQVERGKEQSKD